jgi:TP901 family phage tail tape measure protein
MAATFKIPSVFTAIDKFSTPVKGMVKSVTSFVRRSAEEVAAYERKLRGIGNAAKDVAKKAAVVGAVVAAPLIVAANDAIDFEDKLADVAKTTGLSGKALEQFGGDILNMSGDTRSTIDELVKIGEIGGQLGIAQKDLLGFTDATNKFNVAMGKDFSGGVEEASSKIGNIKSLFQQTRDINIADAITKTGSAINELGAQGSSTSANIADFTLRLGALPDALKPSVTNTLALGAFLEELGIESQIAAGGVSNLLLVAGKNIGKFASQMNISADQAKALLAQDPTEFAKKFATSLNGLSPDKLAKTLEKLGIGSQETIKVIGALGSNSERLTALQELANKAFVDGTSLQNEYNKKNETTAAKLQRAQNNFKALSITIGTQLIPVVSDLLSQVMPVVSEFFHWAQQNPGTVKTIIGLAAAISATSFLVSGVSTAILVYSKVMMIANNISKVSTAAQWLWSKALIIGNNVTKAITAAQWLWNAAMTANPIGIIVVLIGALVAVIVAAIAKYNEWGAAILLILGPFGWLVNIIQAFRRNWDMIKQAFADDGIVGAIKAIGATLLDAVLMPIQQIVSLIADITGAEWAANAVKSIEAFRKDLGVNVSTDESGNALPQREAINPKAMQQEALAQRIESTEKQNVAIDIKDQTGRAKMQTDNNIIPIKLTSTVGAF